MKQYVAEKEKKEKKKKKDKESSTVTKKDLGLSENAKVLLE